MRTICFIRNLVICLLVFVSCNKREKELIHTSSPFNAPVSCISIPPGGEDSVYYAGFENGDIIRVNYRTDSRRLIPTNFANRIYDIIREGDTLWLAIRNEGLVKWSLKSNSIEKSYKIVIPGFTPETGTTDYAPYRMQMDRDGNLFLGTSSGVYRLLRSERNNPADTLTTLYRPDRHATYHFGVNQLEIYGDTVLCAAESGMILLDKKEGRQEGFTLINRCFTHLYQMKDTVYAAFDSGLYRIFRAAGRFVYDSIPFPGGNLFAYAADTCKYNGRWTFTGSEICYSNDKGGLSPFALPEQMNKNYKNYVALGEDFMFFSQGRTVYALALHQNPVGKSNHVIAAHTVGEVCYFISDDHYLYAYAEKKVSRLGSVGNLGGGENILQLCSSDNCLWFITDRKHLYSIGLYPSFLRKINPFQRTYEAALSPLSCDFKSIFYEGGREDNLYIGSRYVLYKIHDPEHKKEWKELDIRNPQRDLYVTDICRYKSSVYISSLNHGLIRINSRDSLETECDTVGNIYKMLVPDRLLLQTSRGVFYKDKGLACGLPVNEKTKFISAIYTAKVPGCGKCVYVGYTGLGTFMADHDLIAEMSGLSNLDIAFNKAAVTSGIVENTYLLGSPTGLYEFDVSDGDTPLKNIPIPEESMRSLLIFSLLAGSVLLLLAGWLILEFYLKKKMNHISDRTRECRNDLGTVKKADQEKLSETLTGLEKRLNRLRTLKCTDKIVGLKKYIFDIKELVKDTDVQTNIRERQITRAEIIGLYNRHIHTLRTGIASYANAGPEWKEHEQWIKAKEQPNDTISASDASLERLIGVTMGLLSDFSEYLPAGHETDLPEIPVPGELAKDIQRVEEVFNRGGSQEIKEACNLFIEKYSSDFRGYINHVEPGNDKAHVLVLYYIKNVEPKEIQSKARYLRMDNMEIGRYKYRMINSVFPALFNKFPELKSHPLFNLLCRRMKTGVK